MFPTSVLVLCTCVVGLSYGAATMTNSWAVQITSGGSEVADALASKYGFVNLGLVGNLKDIYHFLMPVQGVVEKRSISELPTSYQFTQLLESEQNVGYVRQQERLRRYKKEGYSLPTDPNWPDQWSLLNTGQLAPQDAGNDLNVERAWLQGLTGCGSVVAIVDDGVEYTHSDLETNYVSSLQYDFLRNRADAFPVTVDGMRESHGTNVAGEVGMEKGNGVCGVGVSYNAFITGLRLLGAPGGTDIDEAEALSWQSEVIHIYSNSWGPSDDGSTVEGPGRVTQMALETGAREGREGRGSIITFAAGNGGVYDVCAADGYTNSIYTISVGSAASNGNQSSFDENCSAKMVVTYDSNPYDEDSMHVTTTNVQNTCHDEFIGTSASTPLISGVLALLLEANSNLTWRDVQYLLAYTSNPDRLVDGEWSTNGAGLRVSHKFGFGAIDAEAIVSRGRHWTTVPAQLSEDFTPLASQTTIEAGGVLTETFAVQSDIAAVEHVVLILTMSFVGVTDEDYEQYFNDFYNNGASVTWPERGRMQVALTSPSGTTSMLLPLRRADIFPGSYDAWPLMSVHFWGEDPSGSWTLTVRFTDIIGSIEVEVPTVTLYGTSEVPEAVARIPEECSPECDPTRGCAASGAEFCDACQELRVASTLECTSTCPEGLTERNGYCYDANLPESSCEAETPTPGSAFSSPPSVLYTVFVLVLGLMALLLVE